MKIKNPDYSQAEGRHELFEKRRQAGKPEAMDAAGPSIWRNRPAAIWTLFVLLHADRRLDLF